MATPFHYPVLAAQRTKIPAKMASTTATTVAYSSFSSFHCQVCSNTCPTYYSGNLLKVSYTTRTPNITLISSCDQVTSVSKKWKMIPRFSAAVALEEAAAGTMEEEEEEASAVEEEVMEEKGEEGSDRSSNDAGVNTKLYFGNLPFSCDSAQLAEIVQDYAIPEIVEVLYDRETGKSRGFAFVTMSSVEDCKIVIENLKGREYGHRNLRVDFKGETKPNEPLCPETEHKLFIGNLPWSVTSESLAETFQEYGTLVGARVPYDEEKGRPRGYGFVSYETREQMWNALQKLDGTELGGRAIRISLAQGKNR